VSRGLVKGGPEIFKMVAAGEYTERGCLENLPSCLGQVRATRHANETTRQKLEVVLEEITLVGIKNCRPRETKKRANYRLDWFLRDSFVFLQPVPP